MILVGDVREKLRELADESVQCVVTSPPYWGLRDYGTATWSGGDPDCDHKGRPVPHRDGVAAGVAHGEFGATRGQTPAKERHQICGASCGKCGAMRIDSQLGLEATPALYVAEMVGVFREVRRVLRSDGTLWLNLGDSYATGAGRVGQHPGGGAQGEAWKGDPTRGIPRGSVGDRRSGKAIEMTPVGPMTQPNRLPIEGLKAKDLVGIPWRVAFALQEDGWYLRADIIWAKPNPMPESILDRPTKSHEYLFLMTKNARYYYDAAAIREPYLYGRDHHRNADIPPTSMVPGAPVHTGLRRAERMSSGWDVGDGDHRGLIGRYRSGNRARKARPGAPEDNGKGQAGNVPWEADGAGRNRRSVWTIATQPYPEAHFATFPEALVEPCVLAGSKPGQIILDPFAGSGTTLAVAKRLDRNYIGIELNPAYAKLAEKRLEKSARQIALEMPA